MRAVLAVLLLAVSAAPASAGFRYVPPVVDASADGTATEVPAGAKPGAPEVDSPGLEDGSGTERAAPGSDRASAADTGPTVWRVHAGETLREALGRWGGRAGTDVLFLTDRRYRLDGAAAFEGGFADAAQALFDALAHLPHPPAAGFAADGRSLVVTHWAPGVAGTETIP